MHIKEQIEQYIGSLEGFKRTEMQSLHQRILGILPECKLWYLDGKDVNGKIVSNPQIGYGVQRSNLTSAKTKELFQIGISSNSSGISVYILGLEDKLYLINTFGKSIGKAILTGYCIKFKKLSDIIIEVLDQAIVYGYKKTSQT
ncbi:DUF1801 domain-containing protein [Sphingobacterium endophyticum]|uniref:DUF1801 domain-containing protein n=1 Tax=Sphingobacterium endophyticum TaxID=2546448 RepID=UPI0012E19537|nr:DUF1801 domain-containing protein [Sphingobacterium endophyticum]